MFASDISIGIRNILLIQFLMVVTVPSHAFQVRQGLQKIWKNINTPILPKKNALPNKKRGSFWEIDMTKFEP